MTLLYPSTQLPTENTFSILYCHSHWLCLLAHLLLMNLILIPIIQKLSLAICEFTNWLDKRKPCRFFVVVIALAVLAFATTAMTGAAAWCCADTSTRCIRCTSAIAYLLQGRLKQLVTVCYLPKVQKIQRLTVQEGRSSLQCTSRPSNERSVVSLSASLLSFVLLFLVLCIIRNRRWCTGQEICSIMISIFFVLINSTLALSTLLLSTDDTK